MADPWEALKPKPSEKAPAPSGWGNQPWLNVLGQGLGALPGTAVRDAIQAAGSMLSASPSRAATASANEPVGMGVLRMLMGIPTSNPGLGALATGAQKYFAGRYGNVPALKNTIATDPGGVLMDASALAAPLEGGARLAATAPGVVGDAARLAADTARTARESMNPATLAGRGITGLARGIQGGMRGAPAFAPTGELTDPAMAAFREAFPHGEIGSDELNHPPFRAVLARTVAQKGATPAAMKEAVLSYVKSPAPRAVVTGSKVPSGVAGPVRGAIDAGQQAAGSAAAQLASPVDRGALGKALTDAYAAASINRDALYKTAFANPGQIDPTFAQLLRTNIQSGLNAANFPTAADELSRFSTLGNSRSALDFLNGQIGALAAKDDLTFPNLERARQELTALQSGAKGPDRAMTGVIRDAFDNSIGDALSGGDLAGGNPEQAAKDFANARAAHASLKANFENAKTANPVIRRALARATGAPEIDAEDEAPLLGGGDEAAQGVLSSGFFPPKALDVRPDAAKLYSDLSRVLPSEGIDTLNNFIRQRVTQLGDTNAMTAKPAQVRNFLGSSLAGVFDPAEQAHLRLSAAANDILGSPLDYPEQKGLGQGLLGAAGSIIGYGIGSMAPHVFPVAEHWPWLSDAAGAGIGALTGEAIGPVLTQRALRAQMSGAPTPGAWLDPVAKGGQALAAGAAPLPLVNVARQSMPEHRDTATVAPVASVPVDLSDLPGDGSQGTLLAPPPSGAQPADPWSQMLTKGEARPAAPVQPSAVPSQAPQTVQPWSPDLSDYAGQASGGRIERASGGAVEPLVQHLMEGARKAKDAEKAATKPLLKLPDTAVAKALAVAQKAI